MEDNGFKFKEGLELEAYMFSDDEQELHPLKILPRTKSIINGLLVEPKEDNFIQVDHTYLENYIDLTFDESIPDEDLCAGISKLKKEDILLDIDVECPDLQGVDYDIYRTRITDVEKC